MTNMGPPMSALNMPQYSGNMSNTNTPDVHQMTTHYDHLMTQSQHSGYGSGFHNAPIMSQNYSSSVHFQPTTVDYGKMPNDDYTKYTTDPLAKMTPPPPPTSLAPPPQSQLMSATGGAIPSSTIPGTIKTYSDHMNEANWNQMYNHHQIYGPPNEYSQMQQNYSNPNSKYWT